MGKARDSITGKQEIWGGEARKEPLRNLLSRCLLIETLCWIANLERGGGVGGAGEIARQGGLWPCM